MKIVGQIVAKHRRAKTTIIAEIVATPFSSLWEPQNP